jgi:uncharacterized protein YndB with AHSA1/START domain
MAQDPEIVSIPDDSELARLLEQVGAAPLRIEQNGVVYRVSRVTRDDDVGAGDAPESAQVGAADRTTASGRADPATAAGVAGVAGVADPHGPMTEDRRVLHGVLHGSFTVARGVAAPPSRVFAAFADLSIRQRWFRIPSEPGTAQHELDFRVGGGEAARGTFVPADSAEPEQREHIEYHSRFLDIVTDERIVYTYELLLDGRRRSVSLVTVELTPDASGTRMTYTEQYVFVAFTEDGRADVGEREGGTRLQLNGLIAVVERLVEEARR